ncbi:MAG: phosphate ABC transporter permease PstA [candidate division Zixibacteria bacterium]|nr:phosphate ABC transporter permease PstA [candidate division Zixibacteria bacterium]
MTARRKVADAVARQIFRVISYSVVAIFGGIVAYILVRALPVLSFTFLTQPPRGGMLAGGVSTCIYGTVALLMLTAALAVPLGVAAAVYVNEFVGRGARARVVRAAVNNLAGVPSIVFGLFGLAFFVVFLRIGASILAASLTLAVVVLPIVIVATEEALKAVPRDYRLGSAALGATRWQTISRVTLPQAVPGIITGTILSIGRVAGETAPILFTGAAFYLPHLPDHPRQQFMELSYHIFAMATQASDIAKSMPIAFATAFVLLVLVFAFNLIAVLYRARLRRRRAW